MKKILVIDDELNICEVVKDCLDDLGYRVFIATKAMDGLKVVEREHPDLVILDMLMPEVGGLECLKQIKTISPETIVVVVSGMRDEQIAKQAIHKWAFDYITKPYDLVYLQENLLARIFPEEQ